MEKIIGLLQRNVWVGPLIALVLLLGGFAAGLGIGWSTVEFKPGADDVAAVADSYAFNQNTELAKSRLKGLAKSEQEKILNQLIVDRTARNLALEADHLKMLGQALGLNVTGSVTTPPGPGTLAPSTPGATRAPGTPPATSTTAQSAQPTGAISNPLVAVLVILLVVSLIAAAAVIFFLRILPNQRAARSPRATAAPSGSSAISAPVKEPRASGVGLAPTTTSGGLGRFVPTYMLGNDNYDTSYSLETSKGEFLGECGMGISETIGEGKPDKVTAFDLWLFDKADVRTVTQILMSEFAFRDQALRTKLATKGEPVLAEKGRTLNLGTQSLRIEAHIVELIYATNPGFPLNSHFQKLVVEIVPTIKEGMLAGR